MQSVLTRRRFLGFGAAFGGALALGATHPGRAAAQTSPMDSWPTELSLPDGFHPDDIAIGTLPYAYVGSLLGGGIYRASLRTGEGTVIYPGVDPGAFNPQYMAVGLEVDPFGRLLVAGGFGDVIKVQDPVTGQIQRSYNVGTTDTAVYAVSATRWGAWFTDGFNGVIYGLPYGPGGALPSQGEVITLPLTGDWVEGPSSAPSASGITRTPDGSALLLVNLALDGGSLVRVDPATGVAAKVDLGGYALPTALMLTRAGRMLYATPQDGGVTAIWLNRAGTCGMLVTQVTDPLFDAPSGAAVFGDRLYVVNSRVPLPATPTTTYNAVSVPLVRDLAPSTAAAAG